MRPAPRAALALALFASMLRGQTAPLPDAPSPAQRLPSESDADYKARIYDQAERQLKLEERQRILTVVPNFNTVLSGRALPLSPSQKLNLAIHTAIDPFNFIGAVFLGGLDELNDSDRGYGWGPAGYFKRAGANLADTVDGALLAGAAYPILLHQDPRFYRQGTGSRRSRIRHALLAAVICRGDDGRSQFNASNVLGNLTAGAISNAYYPANERGVSLTFINSSIVTLEGSAANVAVEFAPDLSAWWRRRRQKNP